MSKVFITFGAGDSNYYAAVERLTRQVTDLQLFDKVIGYTDDHLKKSSFWQEHRKFVKHNKRGYGYWLWKPYLILKTLRKMNDGDVLLYADCGCEIAVSKKHEIDDFLRNVSTELLYASYAGTELLWTKMDLVAYFQTKYRLSDEMLNSAQYQAGTIMCKKCPEIMQIIQEWYKIACDYHFLDDSPSKLKNPLFREHRHDQSIFSLLCKVYKLYGKKSLDGAIFLSRNKTGTSKI